MSQFPDGPILLKAAGDHVEKMVALLEDVAASGAFTSALAGNIFGTLMSMSSQYFGRCGRAPLRAFSCRQRDLKHVGLNPQLRASCRFWFDTIVDLRPREVLVHLPDLPCAVSHSDGEGADAGIGIA